jgi:regulator of cell morphogenesis and NO signaling
MNTFNTNQKIGEIVTQFPNAAEVFKAYRIDFCCGGDRLLIDALREHNLDEHEVLSKINNLYEQLKDRLKNVKTTDWTEVPLDVLADHIVNTHHAYLYVNLPKIGELTAKILRVHGPNHPELAKVHRLFGSLRSDLESHLIKEETIQYPAIKAYLRSKDQNDLQKAASVINELDEEHVGAGNILKELRKVTDNYRIPEDACPTFKLTYEKLQELESDIFQHIHLENNILFPRLRALNNQ